MDHRERKYYNIDQVFNRFTETGKTVFHDGHDSTLASQFISLLDSFGYKYDIIVHGYETFSVWQVWELKPYAQMVLCYDCNLLFGCTHSNESHEYRLIYPEPQYKGGF
jgi:hypothetical protein